MLEYNLTQLMCIVVCITLHSKFETVLNFAATITSIDEAYSGEKGGGDTKLNVSTMCERTRSY